MTPYTRTEERKLFNYEERASILASTGGKCACCGKKLTTKTMTVEHIIPWSRGGTNDPENLTALCEDCNKRKDNLLYIPMGFYSALMGTSQLKRMNEHVIKWFRTVKEDFDIEMFPLIAPRTNFMITVENRYTKMKYVNGLVLTWMHIGKEYYDEIEAVADVKIRELRKQTRDFHGRDDIPVAIYSLRKLTTDKILMVACVSFDKTAKTMTIYIPWCDMSNRQRPNATYSLVRCLLNSIVTIAEYEIDQYIIISNCPHVLDRFYVPSLPHFVAYKRGDLEIKDRYRDTFKGIRLYRKQDVYDLIWEIKMNPKQMKGETHELPIQEPENVL